MNLYKNIFIHNVSEIKKLWDKDILFLSIVPKIITKTNYDKINKFLIFPNIAILLLLIYKKKRKYNRNNSKNWFSSSYFNNKWKTIYPYTKYIDIDEVHIKEIFVPNNIKRKTLKILNKIFEMASYDKDYVYKFIPYSGKYFKYDIKKGIGASLLIEMYKHLKGIRHHMTFDSY